MMTRESAGQRTEKAACFLLCGPLCLQSEETARLRRAVSSDQIISM